MRGFIPTPSSWFAVSMDWQFQQQTVLLIIWPGPRTLNIIIRRTGHPNITQFSGNSSLELGGGLWLGQASLSRRGLRVMLWGSRILRSRQPPGPVSRQTGLCAHGLAWPAECPTSTGSATESAWAEFSSRPVGRVERSKGSHLQKSVRPPPDPPLPPASVKRAAGSRRGSNSDRQRNDEERRSGQ